MLCKGRGEAGRKGEGVFHRRSGGGGGGGGEGRQGGRKHMCVSSGRRKERGEEGRREGRKGEGSRKEEGRGVEGSRNLLLCLLLRRCLLLLFLFARCPLLFCLLPCCLLLREERGREGGMSRERSVAEGEGGERACMSKRGEEERGCWSHERGGNERGGGAGGVCYGSVYVAEGEEEGPPFILMHVGCVLPRSFLASFPFSSAFFFAARNGAGMSCKEDSICV